MADKQVKRGRANTLGEILSAKRTTTYERIARDLEQAPYFISITDQAIANYHQDKVAKPDLEIVEALVDYYGMTLTELPRELRERMERSRVRLNAIAKRRSKYAPRDSNPEPADSARPLVARANAA